MEDRRDGAVKIQLTQRQLEMLRGLIAMAWQSGATRSREAAQELALLEDALSVSRTEGHAGHPAEPAQPVK